MASITKYRVKSGDRWRVRWSHNGERDAESFADEALALKWKRVIELASGDRARAEAAVKARAVSGATVAENMGKHIDMLTGAEPYQLKRYRGALRLHFGGRLGSMPVALAAHEDVVGWIREMQGKGLSAKTIANHHGLLSASFESAIRFGLRGDNPSRGIRLPKDAATEAKMHVMGASESLRVVESAPERYRPFLRFLRASGARFGEATALRGTDFDLGGPTATVRIEKAWKADDVGPFYVGAPKTRNSRRTVSLDPDTADMLRPLVSRAGRGLVFTTSYGGPIRHSTFHEFWKATLDRLEYPPAPGSRPRIHDMRHTHASLMLAAGMPIFELSRRLGHASITITADRYSHLLEDAHARGAEIASRALRG